MKIKRDTEKYEAWLGRHTPLVAPDLKVKHREMANGVFACFRATFYRCVRLWPEICAQIARAPRVLAVGDLHVENFGTWRDVEGRLVWGVNDFDEAYLMLEMGHETANAHLGSRRAISGMIRDLKKRPADWLRTAAQALGNATLKDWEDWKAGAVEYGH